MTNLEKYTKAFAEGLGIDPASASGLKYQAIKEWDSVGHMQLIAALEEAFDIMMDTEDIIDLSSFEKGIEIMRKYDVEL